MPNISLRIKAIAWAIDLGTIPAILTGVITFFWANQNLTSYAIKYQAARAISPIIPHRLLSPSAGTPRQPTTICCRGELLLQ
jgi:hypothetical protein